MNRDEFLEAAKQKINGERQDDYGDASLNMLRIANRASQHISADFDAASIAMMLVEVKLGRLAHKYKRDSVVDAIGYLALFGELEEAGHGKTEKVGEETTEEIQCERIYQAEDPPARRGQIPRAGHFAGSTLGD